MPCFGSSLMFVHLYEVLHPSCQLGQSQRPFHPPFRMPACVPRRKCRSSPFKAGCTAGAEPCLRPRRQHRAGEQHRSKAPAAAQPEHQSPPGCCWSSTFHQSLCKQPHSGQQTPCPHPLCCSRVLRRAEVGTGPGGLGTPRVSIPGHSPPTLAPPKLL